MAGLRVTTVSTIALLTVGGLIDQGGLGQLMIDGFQDRNTIVLVSVVLIVALALVADALLLLVQRLLTPWERARS